MYTHTHQNFWDNARYFHGIHIAPFSSAKSGALQALENNCRDTGSRVGVGVHVAGELTRVSKYLVNENKHLLLAACIVTMPAARANC